MSIDMSIYEHVYLYIYDIYIYMNMCILPEGTYPTITSIDLLGI